MPAVSGSRRHEFYKSFEAKALRGRPFLIRFSDELTGIFGSPVLLVLHAFFFVIWILINTGSVAAIAPFDPFPFGFLTMVVSLEAIFLSIFVLVSQNRSSYIDSLREELHLQVNLIAEEEITKVLKVLSEIRKKVGIEELDPELETMLKRIDTNYIEKSLMEQMAEANTPLSRDIASSLAHEFPEIVTNNFLTKAFESINTPENKPLRKAKKSVLK